MTQAQELGIFAEKRAAEYILSIGWKILSRNVRNKYGEIDIAALDDNNELVIIEVRARTIGKVQSPFDSIGTRKLRTLLKSSAEYVNDIEWSGFWRIDVIGIIFQNQNDKNNWRLEHVRDITS